MPVTLILGDTLSRRQILMSDHNQSRGFSLSARRNAPLPQGALPNLIVIGAAKCGTTSLHHYLSQHPQICMSHKKELDFFCEDANWQKGQAWYRSHFAADAIVYGESS